MGALPHPQSPRRMFAQMVAIRRRSLSSHQSVTLFGPREPFTE